MNKRRPHAKCSHEFIDSIRFIGKYFSYDLHKSKVLYLSFYQTWNLAKVRQVVIFQSRLQSQVFGESLRVAIAKGAPKANSLNFRERSFCLRFLAR